MKQKLEEANRELQDTLNKIEEMHKTQKVFVASINHELRSPLNGIIGLLQILDEDKTLNEEQTKYIHSALKSSEMMVELVNDLLDAAKMETEGLSITKEDFDIRVLVENIKYAALESASRKGLSLNVNINALAGDELYGDETRIKQIIYNLVSNAIKYTEKGEVSLDVNIDKNNLLTRVSDTGQGIEKEAIDVLFDPFVRINEKKNKHIQGTGLGLFVVKKIIDNMNGTIEVNSVVGEGSVFVVQLPIEYGSIKIETNNTQDQRIDFDNMSVLCVDDTIVNILVFEGLLKNLNVKLDVASSGEEAIAKADSNKYDIIFMDHQMPGMDGIEAFATIRQNSVLNKETPVVVMTANVGKEHEDEYHDMGFDAYLSKPIIKAQLIQCLRMAKTDLN